MKLSLRGRIFVAVVWSACMASVVFGEEGAKARPSVLLGATFSTGLGEQKYAPYAEARIDSGRWRFSTQGELSRKVESGRGYRAGIDAERSFGPVIASVGGRYRDGGLWSKRTAWVGLGLGSGSLRLVARRELPLGAGLNDTMSVTGTVCVGRVEWQGSAYSYRPTFGGPRQTGGTLLLGYRAGAR